MGIAQFITCYNLSCFILASKGPKIQHIFLVRIYIEIYYSYKQNVSECLVLTETLGRWLPISCIVGTFNHSGDNNKKPLINKLEHVLEIWVQYIFCPILLSCPNFTHFRSRLPACLLWFLLNHFCLSYTNSESIGGSVFFFFAALSKICFIL